MMRRLSGLAILTILTAVGPLAAAQPIDPSNCNVELRLRGAIAHGADRRSDLILEFQVRDGQFVDWLRGRTPHLTRNHHNGSVRAESDGQGVKLTVAVEILPDYYVQGGRGEYVITAKPGPDGQWTGQFAGTFVNTKAPRFAAPPRPKKTPRVPKNVKLPPWAKKTVEKQAKPRSINDWPSGETSDVWSAKVSGKVEGRRIAPWPGKVSGHVPVQPGEHPRLIFRRSDLERIKAFAENDSAGQAMMKRFWKVLDAKPQQQGGKFVLWPGVAYGFAYQMTGKDEYAAKARKLVERYFYPAGGQDIHHGPSMIGMALTYDLCYDGWDEEFRRKVAGELQQRVLELYTGTYGGGNMGGLNLAPWSNHNAIRASSYGLGALAILGDPNPDGETLKLAEPIARQAAWEVRYFLRDGLGGGAWFMEGMFYKGMTLRRGVLQFLAVYPKVTGETINPPGYGDHMITGYFIEGWPGRTFPTAEKWDGTGQDMDVDGDPLPDLVWTMGAAGVREEHLPAFKYLLERSVGAEGDGTYGIEHGFLAPFAIAGYPAKVKAQPPSKALPWFSPDPRTGHWVFRNGYKDRNDVLMTLNLQSRVLPSCHHERTGVMSGLRVRALDTTWLNGSYHPVVTGVESAVAAKNGPRTLDWSADGRVVTLTLDASPAYMPPVQRSRKDKGTPDDELAHKMGALRAARFDHWHKPVADFGVRATRHMLVDTSGECGGPLLVAIVEKVTRKASLDAPAKPASIRWSLPWNIQDAKLVTQGRRFTLSAGKGVLAGVVLGGGELDENGTLTAESGQVLTVFVVGHDPAPEVKVTGEGLDAAVTVGKRTVRFRDGKLLAK